MNVGVKREAPEAPTEAKKLTREVFGYLSPRGQDQANFAQCGTCVLFTGERCFILGKTFPVDDDDSCNEYVPGTPRNDLAGKEVAAITPEEAGFVSRAVRCENCRAFALGGVCILYRKLNQRMPEVFDLDEMVEAKGCCTANKKKAK